MNIVFATENPGKLREIQKLATDFGIDVLSPSAAGLLPVSVEETGTSYEENAALKVHAYLGQEAAKKLIICGDDSGVEIQALGNEPGIHTRRWLGYEMTDDQIIGYALGRLHGVQDRTAVFKSTLAYCIDAGAIKFTTGDLKGRITEKPFPDAPIQEGFPYRRIFEVDGDPVMPMWQFDEIPYAERRAASRLSHRELSFIKLFKILTADKD